MSVYDLIRLQHRLSTTSVVVNCCGKVRIKLSNTGTQVLCKTALHLLSLLVGAPNELHWNKGYFMGPMQTEELYYIFKTHAWNVIINHLVVNNIKLSTLRWAISSIFTPPCGIIDVFREMHFIDYFSYRCSRQKCIARIDLPFSYETTRRNHFGWVGLSSFGRPPNLRGTGERSLCWTGNWSENRS